MNSEPHTQPSVEPRVHERGRRVVVAAPPVELDACALERWENAEMLQHVHFENNILFARAVRGAA